MPSQLLTALLCRDWQRYRQLVAVPAAAPAEAREIADRLDRTAAALVSQFETMFGSLDRQAAWLADPAAEGGDG